MPAPKKLVLLGGHGYIGRQIVRAFRQRLMEKAPKTEWTVQVTSRAPTSAVEDVFRRATGVVGERGEAGISFVPCDITEREQVVETCRDADVVVNLVGIMDERPPRWTYDNVQRKGPGHVAEALARGKPSTRLIHISAIGADASSAVPYARTKALGEQAIRDAFAVGGSGKSAMSTRALIIRPGLVIGREDQFLNRFAMLTKYLPVFPVFGGGHSLFQPIVVDDLARIIVNAVVADELPSHGRSVDPVITVEVGGRKAYSFRQLLEMTTRKYSLPANSWLRTFTPPLLIPVPTSIAMAQAFVFEKLMPIGSPLRITRDQVRQLQEDNVVRGSTAYHAVQFRVVGGGEQEDVEAKGKAMREVLLNGLRGDLRCVEDVFVGGGKWKEY